MRKIQYYVIFVSVSLLEGTILTHYDLAAIIVASLILLSLILVLFMDLRSPEVDKTAVVIKEKCMRVNLEKRKSRVGSGDVIRSNEDRKKLNEVIRNNQRLAALRDTGVTDTHM